MLIDLRGTALVKAQPNTAMPLSMDRKHADLGHKFTITHATQKQGLKKKQSLIKQVEYYFSI